ncbi:NAD(P)H-binding protein [Actinocorallia sp. A-T 12471]|uniref:NAD(P)H-binding protein n=1 Tax=Actinocorallia sp. A-T 12471 TaxID=3089813 RepID=UPI0029D2F894|nr:NAD(P)H-binding protein [Actinocorallia sp. A-T 12471]MDX6743228.1 NAD(P)H-binding protein [Actinocorallia sp. A-T 12471]
MRNPAILVVGATGKTGRRVAARLSARGVAVRGVSRSSSPAFHWAQPETYAAALKGVTAAYVTYHPDLNAPEAPDAITAFVEEARAQGVRRLVLLSGRGESGARRCEAIVAESGLEYTVLSAAWFAQNFSEGVLLDQVRAGFVAMAAGAVPEPFVDVEDIADVAVAALTGDAHVNRVYELTGPRALTFHEAAAEIAEAAGRPVVYLPMELPEFRAALAETDGPEYADLITALCAEVFDGRNATPTDDITRALGRAPRDFTTFCHTAAATWRTESR